MSLEILHALKEYIEENMTNGVIQASSSHSGEPVIFSKKANGSVLLSVDYQGLIEITINNLYPLRLIGETLNYLAKAKWYTELNL
jgi:hypothetical protein